MLFKLSSSQAASIAIAALALAALACTAQGLTAPPTLIPIASPTATPSLQPTRATATPAASATVLPTPTQTAMPTAKTKDKTNLYGGPGNNYTLVATLAGGLAVKLTGRNADRSWWQIEFPANPDGHAWALASNLDLGTVTGADALPVVSAPPTPTRSPVTPTRSSTSRPTATVPGLIPILRADRPQLTAGECTTLRWDVENVQAVFINTGPGDTPVAGHDTLWICPDATTTFRLLVVNKDNTTQNYTATVAVSPCGNTPIITRFEASALQVKAGTSVTLAWDVTCAQAVFFKIGSAGRQPVGGHDQAEVKPMQSTLYHLIVVAQDGSEIKRDITITVVP